MWGPYKCHSPKSNDPREAKRKSSLPLKRKVCEFNLPGFCSGLCEHSTRAEQERKKEEREKACTGRAAYPVKSWRAPGPEHPRKPSVAARVPAPTVSGSRRRPGLPTSPVKTVRE